MLNSVKMRHAWPEMAGFVLTRPTGIDNYTFLHFWNPVTLLIDGEKVQAQASACLIYRPTTPQWFQSKVPLVHDWMHITGDVEAVMGQYDLSCDTLYYPSNPQFITKIIQALEDEPLTGQRLSEEFKNIKIHELLIQLSRHVHDDDRGEVTSAEISRFGHLHRHIHQTLGHPWTVAEMAAEIHLGESQFYAQYKKIFGVPPMTDLIHDRVETAKNMLLTGEMTVAQVAETVGYANVTHFIRQFHQMTGMTPGQYAQH